MKLIDKAVSHFNSKEVRSITIPEWDMTLYAKNVSLSDKSNWIKRADGDTTLLLVYAVIFGLTDEKGETVFDVGDKHKLMHHVDPEIVSRLGTFVLTASAKDEEEREKN